MAEIGSLTIDLEARVAGFQKNLKQADKSLKSSTARMNKAMAAADKRAQAFRRTMMRLGATIGSAALIRGMQQFGSNTVDALDAIGKMSSSIDVSAESLQEWRFAATQSSIGAEELDQALERLNRRVGEARAGEGEFASVAEELNINLATTETAFRDVAEAIRTAEDSADAGRIAADAFGRSGLRLINMLRNSEKSLEEMGQEARSMGIIIEERLVKSAERASSEFDRFNKVVAANLQRGYIRQLTGEMDDLSSTLRSQELARGMETIGSGIGAISGFAIDAAAEIGSLRTEISALFDETRDLNQRNLAKTAIGNKFGLFDLLEEWGLIDAAGIPGGSPLGRLNDRSLGSPQQMPPRSRNLNTSDDDSGSGGSGGGGRDSVSGPFGPAAPTYMIDAFQELREARDDRLLELYNEKLEEGAALTRQFATAQQQHASRMANYRELLDSNAIGFDTFQRAVEDSRERMQELDGTGRAVMDGMAQFGDIMSSAFEDAIFRGAELSDVLQGLAEDMQRLFLRSAMQQGSDALMGFVGDALSGMFGGGGSTPVVDTRTPMGSTMPANPFHTGGIAGSEGGMPRLLPSSVFDSAPRFHSGRIPSGIGPSEMPAVIRRDEGVFTPGQMKAMAPAGDQVVNVTVENHSGEQVRQEERQNNRGQRDIRVIIGEIVASEMSRRGSDPDQVMRKQYGLKRQTIRRG